MKRRSVFILIPVLVLVGGFLLFPLNIPYELVSYGKIMPAHRWVLSKGTDGQLIASSINYETGVSEGYRVSQFERGAEMRFTLHPSLIAEGYVAVGDTIGSIYASDVEERLAELNGQLAVAQAALEANVVGEKPSVIREAEQHLAHARAEAVEQQKIVARLQQLYEKNLIAEQEFEVARSKANQLDIVVSIASAQLEAVQTGEKSAQIKLRHARIEAFHQERAALERRLQSFVITTPIEGKISRTFSSDTLLVISDTTTYVAFIPIKWNDYKYLSEAQSVSIRSRGAIQTVTGELVSLDKEVHVIQGEQVVVVAAVLKKVSGEIMSGMLAQCVITCKPVSTLEYVRRVFNAMMA